MVMLISVTKCICTSVCTVNMMCSLYDMSTLSMKREARRPSVNKVS